jgi:hypothetical protein
MTLRFLGLGVILLAILVLPYWVYLPMIFAGMIFFPMFWEGLIFVFLVEILHGSHVVWYSLLVSPLPFSALIVLIVILLLRNTLRIYV